MARKLGRPVVFIGSSTPALDIAKAVGRDLKEVADVWVWDSAFDEDAWLLGGILNRAQEVDFAIFVIRKDDILRIRNTEYRSVRDNVLFEAGVFMGALGVERTVLLWPDSNRGRQLRLPSDLEGLLRARYTPRSKNGRKLNVTQALATIRRKIASLGPALRTGYNEIAALRRAMEEEDVVYKDDSCASLGDIVQRAATRRSRPWFGGTSVTQLTAALKKDNHDSVVDIVFWWLIVYGVITFDNLELWSSDGSWHWIDSVDYTKFTERGVVLLNLLRATSQAPRSTGR